MNTAQAINLARTLKDLGPTSIVEQALVELLEHGDRIIAPDFEMIVRMLGANIHAQGKFYIEVAVEPGTKEVAFTFDPTPDLELKKENERRADLVISATNKITELLAEIEALKREKADALAARDTCVAAMDLMRAQGWRLPSD